MERIYNIFEILKIIQLRPGIYLVKQRSLYSLLNFISGYFTGFEENLIDEKLLRPLYYKFQDYIVENTIKMENRTNECWTYWDCLLKVTNGNDEKAFDLFFVLIDKFMIQENIILGQDILELYNKINKDKKFK